MKVKSSMMFAVILCASVVQAKTATEVFQKVSPSVVVIKTYDATGKGQSLGSGVVLEDGVVVTNCHVVKEATTMQVVRHEVKYHATLRHTDWDRDVCTLNVDGLKGQAVTRGSTIRLKVGEKVYAIGAPKGLELTLSDGLISSLRPVPGGQYLQITAPISPGSSGGGLFDDGGRLIGLPTFYLAEGQQLNFAVPVEWINELPKRNVATPNTEKKASTGWLNRSIELEKKKDWAGMIEHTLRWTKAQPDDVVAWYNLGIAYGDSGQTAKAIEAYRQAIRINPEYDNAWLNLGVAYGDSGQTAKAIEADQQAIRINPENDSAWNNLGAAYGVSGQTAKAIEAHQQAIRINSENADAWYNLGVAYRESGQATKETEAYQQSIRIDPKKAPAWHNLGIAYKGSGQIDKAIEAYQQAIRINPEDVSVWYNLGVAYWASGQTSQVMEVYKRIKTLDPAMAIQFYNKVVLF
jgi:tetratricopeptide (TPR) repeat protein